MEKIAGISTTAPLWNGVSYEKLTEIVEMLSRASYCFADDSAREWGKAQTLVAAAAKAINQHKLCASAIIYLHKDKSQLVTLDQLLDAVLKDARKKTDGPNLVELLEFTQQIFNGIDTGMITIDTPADEALANILSRGRKALSKATGEA